jgi:hypothetical protein
LEEKKQLQDALAKEAADKAAAAAEEQTKVLIHLSTFQKRQAEIEKEKDGLVIKYWDQLCTRR